MLRYTLPDFFPDFNETPLEARITAPTPHKAQAGRGGGGGGGGGSSRTCGNGACSRARRSDPLDVIAKDRERFERTLRGEGREFAPADEDSNDDMDTGLTNAGGSGPRRAIPPPPGTRRGPGEPGATKALRRHPLLLPRGAGGDVVEEHWATGRRRRCRGWNERWRCHRRRRRSGTAAGVATAGEVSKQPTLTNNQPSPRPGLAASVPNSSNRILNRKPSPASFVPQPLVGQSLSLTIHPRSLTAAASPRWRRR